MVNSRQVNAPMVVRKNMRQGDPDCIPQLLQYPSWFLGESCSGSFSMARCIPSGCSFLSAQVKNWGGEKAWRKEEQNCYLCHKPAASLICHSVMSVTELSRPKLGLSVTYALGKSKQTILDDAECGHLCSRRTNTSTHWLLDSAHSWIHRSWRRGEDIK